MFVRFLQQRLLVDRHVRISMDLDTDLVYVDVEVEVVVVDVIEALNMKMHVDHQQHHFQSKITFN
jgi:hypothetical protein